MVDIRAKNSHIPDGDWKNDEVTHQRLAAAKRSSLPLNEQGKFVGQAKAARRLLCHGECGLSIWMPRLAACMCVYSCIFFGVVTLSRPLGLY